MKKFLLFILLFLLTLISTLNAQVRRIVLLEEATNTSCPPCAENNPKLQAFFKSHFGGVISVRYHAWWPGGNDPMYLLNPLENRNRIQNYYGIWGVPHYLMDGINYGEPLDSLLMIDQMNYHLSITAPVKIEVNTNIDADSVRATLKLTGISPVSQTQLKLRSAVIERMVQYSSPPGSNGETIFPDVFRKMLPDTNGFSIENINPGDELIFYVSYPVNSEWNWQDLAVVAWLQSDENLQPPIWPYTFDHEIIQSAISIPTYKIKSDDPLGMFLSTEQNYSTTLKIVNDNDVNLHLRLKVTEAQVPAGWNYNFTYNNIGFDSVDVSVAPGDSVFFGLNVNTNSDPGIIRLALFAQNLDDPYSYGNSAHYIGVTITEGSNVLFIDDDGGETSEIFYKQAFDNAGVKYICIERHLASILYDQILEENFKAIFWNISKGTFHQQEIDFLINYLNSGGNLFIAISNEEFFGTWFWFIYVLWNYQALDFCHNYLDTEFYFDEGIFHFDSFTGITGTLGSGITTDLNGNSQLAIGSYSGVSDTIFQYTGTTNYGGVSYDAGTYKTVFLGAGLEQFTTALARQLFLQRVVDWFGIPVGVSDEKINIPNQYNLEQNFPNPLNPSTAIKYSIPQSSNVVIKVFDILGNEIETLVNEEKPAGTYEITWYAANLPSGVYFYQLRAGSFVETKKMILLK